MKFCKLFFSIIALGAVLATSAHAQYASATVTTNTVAANSTNVLPVIQVSKTDQLALQLVVSSTNAAAAANVTVSFARSIDGSIYDSSSYFPISAVLSGTNTVRGTVTNVSVGAIQWIRPTLVNTGATTLNATIITGKKQGF